MIYLKYLGLGLKLGFIYLYCVFFCWDVINVLIFIGICYNVRDLLDVNKDKIMINFLVFGILIIFFDNLL